MLVFFFLRSDRRGSRYITGFIISASRTACAEFRFCRDCRRLESGHTFTRIRVDTGLSDCRASYFAAASFPKVDWRLYSGRLREVLIGCDWCISIRRFGIFAPRALVLVEAAEVR